MSLSIRYAKYLWLLTLGLIFLQPVMAADLDCSTANNINVPVAECEALLDFYDSTGGPDWNINTNRDTDTDICSWYGITCANIAWQDRVVTINLWDRASLSNNLQGVLPAWLSALTELFYFSLAPEPGLVWTLPSERSSLTKILDFQIAGTNISGELPSSWSSWTDMWEFVIVNTNISGELPSEWSTWTDISVFNIENTNISGELPSEWSTWTNIYIFNIQNTNISGELPSEWSTWTNMLIFTIENTNISGELPSEWSTWTNIQTFVIENTNISGELPSEWSTWTNIRNFRVPSNNISWMLPDSRWARWTVGGFDVQNNKIYGHIPESWMTYLNSDNRFLVAYNCLWDHEYTQDQQDWIAIHTIYDPQDTCAQTDVSITKTSDVYLVETGSIIQYEIQYHNSWYTALWAIIYENPGTWLSIISATQPYTLATNKEYWIPWDLCYDQLYNYNTWYYLTLLDARVATTYDWMLISTLQEYVEGWLWYMGADWGAYFIDEGVILWEWHDSFQEFMILEGIDMTGDPDCWYVDGDLIVTYVFAIWDIASHTSWLIHIVWEIADMITTWQTTIQNTVSIHIQNPETNYDNNTYTTTNYFSFSPPVYGCTDPQALNHDSDAQEDDGSCEYPNEEEEDVPSSWGWWWVTITQDHCPDGDFSGSYYDGLCDAPSADSGVDTPSHHPSPSPSNICDIYDDKSSIDGFVDIIDTPYYDAVALLVDNCLVHGYYNKGEQFGIGQATKISEVYKVFARISRLPISQQVTSIHRSDVYKIAGESLWLRDGIDVSQSPESYATQDDIRRITINYLRVVKGLDIQYRSIDIPQSMTREDFAIFIKTIIQNI